MGREKRMERDRGWETLRGSRLNKQLLPCRQQDESYPIFPVRTGMEEPLNVRKCSQVVPNDAKAIICMGRCRSIGVGVKKAARDARARPPSCSLAASALIFASLLPPSFPLSLIFCFGRKDLASRPPKSGPPGRPLHSAAAPLSLSGLGNANGRTAARMMASLPPPPHFGPSAAQRGRRRSLPLLARMERASAVLAFWRRLLHCNTTKYRAARELSKRLCSWVELFCFIIWQQCQVVQNSSLPRSNTSKRV